MISSQEGQRLNLTLTKGEKIIMGELPENNKQSGYEKTKLNNQLFIKSYPKMQDYFESVRYFFTKDYIKPGYNLLDIGGAGGDLAYAIKNEIAEINATIIDPDFVCIKKGEQNYPEFKFIQGYFPNNFPYGHIKFDCVSMQALFPQIPDWKNMLLALRKYTKKYINFSAILRLDGTTVVDKDVSYFYYLDSGERIHQVIHNLYEIINFLCIYEMGAKKVEFYGYHTPYAGHNFRCIPNAEQIKGNFMIEVFENNNDNPIRMGGAIDKGEKENQYKFYIPEINIIIDGNKINIR